MAGLRIKATGAFSVAALLFSIGGCATMPPAGPSVMVLPAPGKPFEVFQGEDANCKRWAAQNSAVQPQDVYEQGVATGATAGTILGAGVGALLGAATGHAGAGAAIGAGSGLLLGTAAGVDSGQHNARLQQRSYDSSYLQCMYAYGNQIQTAPAPPATYYVVPHRHRYYW